MIPELNKRREYFSRRKILLRHDRLIHHYTSFESFKSIVETKQLWLTHYKKLADSTEFETAAKLIDDEFDKKIRSSPNKKFFQLFKNSKAYYLPNTYIACFAASSKNAHLWRQYGDNNHGVAIGFDYFDLIKKTL